MNYNDLPDEIPAVLPSSEEIHLARSKLLKNLPEDGIGEQATEYHLHNDLVPGFNRPSKSPRYFGFVTGGTTPASVSADHLVTQTDQSPQVHLPNETISTAIDDRALYMLCQLLELRPEEWRHRIFTTGATASNVLGLACAREHILRAAAERNGSLQTPSVAEHGISQAMALAGVRQVQILTTVPHSSLRKAASIVGLGRSSVIEVGQSEECHRFNMSLIEQRMQAAGVAPIVAVSCAEVNTGFFATTSEEMALLRSLCDKYGAWLHVDAAFGLLARVLPDNPEYQTLRHGVAGLELADSIAGDAHKLINVVSAIDFRGPANRNFVDLLPAI
jgi:glutamate/tyrosine decarboxylase-like PLP-dependent enzyme